MAAPGPAPSGRGVRPDRSDGLEWTDVADIPVEPRPCPRDDIHPDTLRWWNTVTAMPHTVLYSESDWTFAEDLLKIKDKFYRDELADSALSEMRRREDVLGTTFEARRKLRIRYVKPPQDDTRNVPVPTAAGVVPIDRRARLLASTE